MDIIIVYYSGHQRASMPREFLNLAQSDETVRMAGSNCPFYRFIKSRKMIDVNKMLQRSNLRYLALFDFLLYSKPMEM